MAFNYHEKKSKGIVAKANVNNGKTRAAKLETSRVYSDLKKDIQRSATRDRRD